MSITLDTTMDALASATASATGIERTYAQPTEAIVPTCIVVGYPEGEIDFDVTFGRGADRAEFPVWAVLGLQQDAQTRSDASDLITSATDVKSSIEADATLLAMGSIHVTGCRIEGWNLAGEGQTPIVHTAVRFTVEVIA